MIGYLRGTVLVRRERSVVLLTSGGVGYEVNLTLTGAAGLPLVGQALELYVHTAVREDAIELYGFAGLDDRDAFELLLGISRLGPKTALSILSCFDAAGLRELAIRDDVAGLARVPGIGKKSAQRIFVELKYRFEGASGPGANPAAPPGVGPGVLRDAVAGLANLGYDESEAARVVRAVLEAEPDLDVAQTLRQALKRLARERT